MKKLNYRIVSFVMLLFVAGACDSFLDINVSPNSTTSPPPRTLLAGASTAVAFHMGSDIHRYTSEWVQQFTGGGASGTQTVEYSHYNVTATDMNNAWRTGFFGDALADLQKLREMTQEKSPRYAGIAKLLQAFMFSVATDAWGNIPYSEALKFDKNVKPKYDNSSDIYTSLFALIDEGIADLGAATSELTPGVDDMVYAGNLNRWIRFANSLKLRMLIKYYPTNASFANTQIAALVASAQFISSNAESFQVAFETTTNRQNAIDQFERSRSNQFWPTTTLVDMMNLTNDPRRQFYFSQPSAGVFTGLAPGAVVTSPTTSRMHTFLRGAVTTGGALGYAGDAPQRMLTYAEHNFNLAEYYLRTGQTALAQTAFQAGITANMTEAGVSAANQTTYITANGTLSGTLATAIQQIITEKYIANYGVAVQPWSDWRRTGFPLLSPASGAVLPAIPRILPYSDIERVTNPENTPTRETTDLIAPNVFWDPGV